MDYIPNYSSDEFILYPSSNESISSIPCLIIINTFSNLSAVIRTSLPYISYMIQNRFHIGCIYPGKYGGPHLSLRLQLLLGMISGIACSRCKVAGLRHMISVICIPGLGTFSPQYGPCIHLQRILRWLILD